MEETKKKINPKIAKRFILIGCIILVAGIVMIGFSISNIISVNKENDKLQEAYDIELKEYREGSTASAPEMPKKISLAPGIALCFGGVVVINVGLIFIFEGLSPFLLKLGAKKEKELLDYAGDDIAAVGVREVEVAEPIINKGVDVIAPNLEKISRSVRKGSSEAKSNKGKYCTKCGKKMDENEAYCGECGTKCANVCECGHANDLSSKFCGKCGKPLE